MNAAAYTAVDRAEAERDLAFAVNADAPGAIARACEAIGARLLTVSTDYVFDGSKTGPYLEDDPVSPANAYGASKAAGEALVAAAGGRHVIVRTSWVFAPYGTNFARTMLRLGAERRELRVVDDQRGRPTYAPDLAAALIAVAARAAVADRPGGIVHAANAGETSWHGFARAVFDGARARGAPVPERLHAIPTSEYPTPARRPANSTLGGERLAQDWGVALRPWTEALDDCLDRLLERSAA